MASSCLDWHEVNLYDFSAVLIRIATILVTPQSSANLREEISTSAVYGAWTDLIERTYQCAPVCRNFEQMSCMSSKDLTPIC